MYKLLIELTICTNGFFSTGINICPVLQGEVDPCYGFNYVKLPPYIVMGYILEHLVATWSNKL